MPADSAFADAVAEILAVDDFRDAAIFTPLVGDPVSCNVHFMREVNPQPDGHLSATWTPQCTIESDYSVTGEPTSGDVFTIASGTNAGSWTVTEIIENNFLFVKANVK